MPFNILQRNFPELKYMQFDPSLSNLAQTFSDLAKLLPLARDYPFLKVNST
jgi:hypothetical protein